MAEDLKLLIIKLLRKTRKNVPMDKWEHAVAKFCHGYSAQDAWEIERFGYKKASLAVKLRVLKVRTTDAPYLRVLVAMNVHVNTSPSQEILECQFERNVKFKADVNLVGADELRTQPIGKDQFGNSYWGLTDEQLNLRIYQEHLDEDIWKLVANDRDQLVQLIACLRGNDMRVLSHVAGAVIGLADEDSSSNSMTAAPKVDALLDAQQDPSQPTPTTVAEKPPATEIKVGGETAPPTAAAKETAADGDAGEDEDDEEDEEEEDEDEDAEEEDDEEDDSNDSDVDESSQAASEDESSANNKQKLTVGLNEKQNHLQQYKQLISICPAGRRKTPVAARLQATVQEDAVTRQTGSGCRPRRTEIHATHQHRAQATRSATVFHIGLIARGRRRRRRAAREGGQASTAANVAGRCTQNNNGRRCCTESGGG